MRTALILLGVFLLAVFLLVLGSFIFMWAWNTFVVVVFGVPTIDLLTAFAGWMLLSFIGGAVRGARSRR